MATYEVNTRENFCLATFWIPQNLEPEDTAYLRGRVVVSCQDGIAKGDSILTAGDAVRFVIDNSKNGEQVFRVELTENKKAGEAWFANKVGLPSKPPIERAMTLLAGLEAQVKAVRSAIGT